MSFEEKIVAFDLDGTLAESNQKMKSDMAEALLKLLKLHKVILISGASYIKMLSQLEVFLNLKDFQSDQNIKLNFFLLPTNGIVIYKYDKNLDSFKTITPPEAVLKDKRMIIEALNNIVSSGKFDIAKEGKGNVISDRGNQISLAGLGQDASLSEKKLWDPDHKKRQAIKAEIEKHVQGVEVVIGGNSTIDILPKGFNKAVGLTHFLEILNFKKDDMVFMGDAIFPGGNDYSVAEAGFKSIKISGPEEVLRLITI